MSRINLHTYILTYIQGLAYESVEVQSESNAQHSVSNKLYSRISVEVIGQQRVVDKD